MGFGSASASWSSLKYVKRWASRNIVTLAVVFCILLMLYRQQFRNNNNLSSLGKEDDETRQYIIPKEDVVVSSNLRSSNKKVFGEGPKASRPGYHWEEDSISSSPRGDGTTKTGIKMTTRQGLKEKWKRQYSKLSRPLTETEIRSSLRNLTFYKQQEVTRELQEQPYLYIQKFERGYLPKSLRIVIENVTYTTFETLNKDFPEIGLRVKDDSSTFSRLANWFTGVSSDKEEEHEQQQRAIINTKKKSTKDLAGERKLKIDEENRRSMDIVLLVIASDAFSHGNMISRYQDAMNTIKNYADQNRYQFRIIDPQPIIDKYGTFIEQLATELRNLRTGDRMKVQKSLIMLYTLRKIYQELSTQSVNMSRDGGNVNGPIDTWAVFLDADVIIANPQYRIEDIIHHTRVVLKSSACEVISQLSLSTINTGVMMFRVSQISDILIQQWISLSVMGLIQSTDWQHEQGWFEYLYLLYLQRHIYGLYPFVIDHELDSLLSYEAMNCGFRVRKSNQHIGVRDVPLAVIRGRCFMKSLAIMEALPVQYESTSLLKSVFRVDNVQKELHMCMLTGLEIVNPLSSVISSIGFFNMHDWSGEDRFVSSGGNQRTDNHYVF